MFIARRSCSFVVVSAVLAALFMVGPVEAQQGGANTNILPIVPPAGTWDPLDPSGSIVNVGPDGLPTGDYLPEQVAYSDLLMQRQVECNIEASTRNPNHLFAICISYAAVDVPDDQDIGGSTVTSVPNSVAAIEGGWLDMVLAEVLGLESISSEPIIPLVTSESVIRMAKLEQVEKEGLASTEAKPKAPPVTAFNATNQIAFSYDGGATWSGGALPGRAFSDECQTSSSPYITCQDAGQTDPILVPGPCGFMHVVELSFTPGEGEQSQMVIHTYQDSNDSDVAHTWEYKGLNLIDRGNNSQYGTFLDKEDGISWLVNGGQGCAHEVAVSYTAFNGQEKDGKVQTKVNVARTQVSQADFPVGAAPQFGNLAFDIATNVFSPFGSAQGTALAHDPGTNQSSTNDDSLYLFVRNFYSPDAILMTKLGRNGRWGKPINLTANVPLAPFDSPTYVALPEFGDVSGDRPFYLALHRTNGYPSATVANGQVWVAWQERVSVGLDGPEPAPPLGTPDSRLLPGSEPGTEVPLGSPRIVAMRSLNGGSSFEPVAKETVNGQVVRKAVDTGPRDAACLEQPLPAYCRPGAGYLVDPRPFEGLQIMPSLAFDGELVGIAYYEGRGFILRSQNADGTGPLVRGGEGPEIDLLPDDSLAPYLSGLDHVIDLRVALFDPTTGGLAGSNQISNYPIRSDANLDDGEQLEDVYAVNFPCYPDHENLFTWDPEQEVWVAFGRAFSSLPSWYQLPLEPCRRRVNRHNALQSGGGVASFMGDYNHLIPTVAFVPAGPDQWKVPARGETTAPGFRTIWATNHNLVPPSSPTGTGEWLGYRDYSPPFLTTEQCVNLGSRNTDAYTAFVDSEILIKTPATFRALDGKVSFPLQLSNGRAEEAYYQLVIDPGFDAATFTPPICTEFSSPPASCPDAPETEGLVTLLPYSSNTQMVYANEGVTKVVVKIYEAAPLCGGSEPCSPTSPDFTGFDVSIEPSATVEFDGTKAIASSLPLGESLFSISTPYVGSLFGSGSPYVGSLFGSGSPYVGSYSLYQTGSPYVGSYSFYQTGNPYVGSFFSSGNPYVGSFTLTGSPYVGSLFQTGSSGFEGVAEAQADSNDDACWNQAKWTDTNGDDEPDPPAGCGDVIEIGWTVTANDLGSTAFMALLNIDNAEEFLKNYEFFTTIYRSSSFGELLACEAKNAPQDQIVSSVSTVQERADTGNYSTGTPYVGSYTSTGNPYVGSLSQTGSPYVGSFSSTLSPSGSGTNLTTGAALATKSHAPGHLVAPRQPDQVQVLLRAVQKVPFSALCVDIDEGTETEPGTGYPVIGPNGVLVPEDREGCSEFVFNPDASKGGDPPSITVVSLDCNPAVDPSCFTAQGPDLVPSEINVVDPVPDTTEVIEFPLGGELTIEGPAEEGDEPLGGWPWFVENRGNQPAGAENRPLRHNFYLCPAPPETEELDVTGDNIDDCVPLECVSGCGAQGGPDGIRAGNVLAGGFSRDEFGPTTVRIPDPIAFPDESGVLQPVPEGDPVFIAVYADDLEEVSELDENNNFKNADTPTNVSSGQVYVPNEPPVAGPVDLVTTPEDTAVLITLVGSDPDNGPDPLTFTLETLPANGDLYLGDPAAAGALLIETAGFLENNGNQVYYLGDPDYHGPDSFTFSVDDGRDSSPAATVEIGVTAVDDAPRDLTFLFDGTVTEDSPEGGILVAFDAEGQPQNYQFTIDSVVSGTIWVGDPANGGSLLSLPATLTPVVCSQDQVATDDFANYACVEIFFVPDADFFGTASFTFTVVQLNSDLSATETIELVVQAVPDAPVAVADNYSTDEELELTVSAPGVLKNDTDADGDVLTVVLVANVASEQGSLTLNADGSFTYVPALDFNGAATFTYKASDGELFSSPETVTINVSAVNDAPVAVADNYSINEEELLTVAAPGVLGNDTDADGDVLTAVLVGDMDPAKGLLEFNADGSFTYTPAVNFDETASFTYKVRDRALESDPDALESGAVTVTITVNGQPDPPIANDDAATMYEDSSAEITVLLNDGDPDDDSLSVVSATAPSNGSAVVNASGTITYTPNANFNGTDSFSYTVSDGTGRSDTATVTVTVKPVDDPPTAVPDTFQAVENGPAVDLDVLFNDVHVDGDSFSISSVSAVTPDGAGTAIEKEGGCVRTAGSGPVDCVTFVPGLNFEGTASFTYTITDAVPLTSTTTVTVNVDGLIADYCFLGLLSPYQEPKNGTYSVNGGSSTPLSWQYGDPDAGCTATDYGAQLDLLQIEATKLDPSAVGGNPKRPTCSLPASEVGLEVLIPGVNTPGNSNFQYDGLTHQFNWQTPTVTTNTCFAIRVRNKGTLQLDGPFLILVTP